PMHARCPAKRAVVDARAPDSPVWKFDLRDYNTRAATHRTGLRLRPRRTRKDLNASADSWHVCTVPTKDSDRWQNVLTAPGPCGWGASGAARVAASFCGVCMSSY